MKSHSEKGYLMVGWALRDHPPMPPETLRALEQAISAFASGASR